MGGVKVIRLSGCCRWLISPDNERDASTRDEQNQAAFSRRDFDSTVRDFHCNSAFRAGKYINFTHGGIELVPGDAERRSRERTDAADVAGARRRIAPPRPRHVAQGRLTSLAGAAGAGDEEERGGDRDEEDKDERARRPFRQDAPRRREMVREARPHRARRARDPPAAQRAAGTLAKLLLRHEHRRRDRLLVRTGTGEGDHPKAVLLGHEGLGRHAAPTEEDEAYIRAVFGRSAISDAERRTLENDLCVDADADCRVWVTKGEAPDLTLREAADVRESSLRQQERNRAFLDENAAALAHAIKALTTRIETVLSSYLKHLPEPARSGRISPEKAWRLPLLGDDRVFLKNGEEVEQEIFVDLLLDASQSRRNMQELLAAEAYVAAKSLTNLHIPVRVSAFRSIRGHTVLDILKSADRTDCRGTLRFYAGGWNRDSLALRLLGHLDDDPALRGKRRILLIMTDASPNDSSPIAAGGRFLAREYEGDAAVRLTEKAVRELKNDGIRVGAVFHGTSSHLEDLGRIYGHACIRIRKPSQLAQGFSDLLLLLLREMRGD